MHCDTLCSIRKKTSFTLTVAYATMNRRSSEMEAETIIYNLTLRLLRWNTETPVWVPKVLIGKRSAMPGSDERKCLGRMDSCGNTANWLRHYYIFLTWLALYDHEEIIVSFSPVIAGYFLALGLSLSMSNFFVSCLFSFTLHFHLNRSFKGWIQMTCLIRGWVS